MLRDLAMINSFILGPTGVIFGALYGGSLHMCVLAMETRILILTVLYEIAVRILKIAPTENSKNLHGQNSTLGPPKLTTEASRIGLIKS